MGRIVFPEASRIFPGLPIRTAAGQRSAQAAREIKGLIDDSVARVGNGSGLVEKAGATMKEMMVAVDRVTNIVGDISSASERQSSWIGQINDAMMQMDQVTQQNAALVEEAAAAAASLEGQAKRLHTSFLQLLMIFSKTMPNISLATLSAHISRALTPGCLHLAFMSAQDKVA